MVRYDRVIILWPGKFPYGGRSLYHMCSFQSTLDSAVKQNHFSKQPITQLIDNSTCGIVVTFPFIEISLNVTDCIFQFYKRRKYVEAQTERHILMLFYVSDLGPLLNLRLDSNIESQIIE